MLPALISRLMKQLGIQKKFLQENIHPFLDQAIANNDGSLDQKDLDKIDHYYGLAVPAILGEAFCALRGTEMTIQERWASTCQGSMTGLFDDFFDKDYLEEEVIEKMISGDNSTSNKRSNQKLFDLFYTKALQYAPDENSMKKALAEVYKAQVASKEQENGKLPEQELSAITLFNGGSSLVFYRTAFSPVATGKELRLLNDLGGLMQLANDIFDVYKDRESGIQTLVTATKHIAPISNLLRTRLQQYYLDALDIGYPKKNVHLFMDIISLGIFSRCFVCLDQLEKNERSTGNEFLVAQYSRKQLICDMDTKMNMLRSAWSHVYDIP